ncbi:MAG: hypothetical protein OXC19_22395, partial [Bryobacterales bacterium]|nr:hypothetical protein [Bryobacterales bacterium]
MPTISIKRTSRSSVEGLNLFLRLVVQLVKKGALRDSTITGALGALKEFLEATLDLRVLQDLAIATIIVALTPCHATGGTKVEVSEV